MKGVAGLSHPEDEFDPYSAGQPLELTRRILRLKLRVVRLELLLLRLNEREDRMLGMFEQLVCVDGKPDLRAAEGGRPGLGT